MLGAYSVSKTALLGLTKAAAIDLASDNIRVNCLAPGIVETRFSSAVSYSIQFDFSKNVDRENNLLEGKEVQKASCQLLDLAYCTTNLIAEVNFSSNRFGKPGCFHWKNDKNLHM
jgi:NAD(P)-dependent dehydrogenase (short-subunit alcohol dehydrogenase family)